MLPSLLIRTVPRHSTETQQPFEVSAAMLSIRLPSDDLRLVAVSSALVLAYSLGIRECAGGSLLKANAGQTTGSCDSIQLPLIFD